MLAFLDEECLRPGQVRWSKELVLLQECYVMQQPNTNSSSGITLIEVFVVHIKSELQAQLL